MILWEPTVFASRRRKILGDADAILGPAVRAALARHPNGQWWTPILDAAERVFRRTFREESGTNRHPNLDDHIQAMRGDMAMNLRSLHQVTPNSANLIIRAMSSAAVNAATAFAASVDEEDLTLTWHTMHDSKVRHAHAEADGQTVPVGHPFDIAGHPMRFPGDPRAPIELWVNCRCVVVPGLSEKVASTLLPSPNGSTGKLSETPMGVSSGPGLSAEAAMASTPSGNSPSRSTAGSGSSITESFRPAGSTTSATAPRSNGANVPVGSPANTVAASRSPTLLSPPPPSRLPEPSTIAAGSTTMAARIAALRAMLTTESDAVPTGRPSGSADNANGTTYAGSGQLPAEEDTMTAPAPTEVTPQDVMPETTDEATDPLSPPLTEWHSVLAPEGVFSGDGRRFKAGSLRNRDLPLPISWQKISDDRHKGSVVVGQIQKIFRDGSMVKGAGTFESSPEADEVIGLIASGSLRGVSVDVDDATAELDPENEKVTFSDGRICSVTIVPIPAFQEAYIALGPWEDANVTASCLDCGAPSDEFKIDESPWSNYKESDYTVPQWHAACLIHLHTGAPTNKTDCKLPVRTPGGALNRAGVHAAAAALAGGRGGVDAPPAHKAAARAKLRGLYGQLKETPPDSIKAEEGTEDFGRGPGWVTNPEATRRLHNYWVRGEGAAKIRWGEPNDFYRCRTEVGEEIGESSPEKLRFINQICAQWHKDALGVWPGQEGGGRHHHHDGETISAAVNLVASADLFRPPPDWFTDPHFIDLAPLAVTDEGRVFGHIAGWHACHTGFPGVCVTPPHSSTGYAEFLDGYVVCDDGSKVAVGPVTMDGEHADLGMDRRRAMRHYSDTTLAVADVAVGEDDFGIWCAGYVRPGVPEEKIAVLRASKLSGDWRGDELILALAVNKPGFLNPRIGITDGRQTALVAAGIVEAADEPVNLVTALADEMELRDRKRRRKALLAEVLGSPRERLLSLAASAGISVSPEGGDDGV